MASTPGPSTDDLFVALRHPIRREILRKLLKRDRELSPRELSDEIGQPLSKLSYHVRILAECGAIELTGTRRVRGSTQHFYRAVIGARWARTALRARDEL